MKAVVLLSGGIDSTVTLAIALAKGRECHALSFNYRQRHAVELEAAKQIAGHYKVPHTLLHIDPNPISNSPLIDGSPIPVNRSQEEILKGGIPSTYVPARNTLFLAYAMGLAETLSAGEIYYGPNRLDHQGYPDCHPRYILAFQALLNVATREAVNGNPPLLVTPLLHWDKARTIDEGRHLKAPLELTFSCYNPTPTAEHCHECDACVLRFSALEQSL